MPIGDLARQDTYDLPDVGDPLVPAGPQVSAGTPWANKTADVLSRYPGHVMGGLLKLPQQAFEASEERRLGGEYDPAPIVAAATLPMGTGAIAGVPVKGAEAVFGAGAVRSKPVMGELAEPSTYSMPKADPILPGDTRVSTRFPTAVKATQDPLKEHLSIGAAEMRASPEFEHNIGLLSDYPGFARLKGMDPEQAMKTYIDQAQGNLQFLYDKSPQVMKERSPLWYEGAHEVSDALAKRWDVPRPSASGALASLSPQMDWFKNASLGERTGDIMTSAAAGKLLTPEMKAFGDTAKFLNDPKAKANAELYQSIQGKTLDQLEDPLQKALWIRLYDEAHNPRNYRSVTPEGHFGEYITNQDGSLSKVGWGALGEIQKAVRSLESGGDPAVISPVLGTKHKVRSFYNNIEAPNDPRFGDVTADTHQVAGAQLMPLSGSAPAVQHNLASGGAAGATNARSSAVTGVQGTYGLVADATRQMAAANSMIPRAAQSATWEPVRELFPAKFKTAKNVEAVGDIWREYDRGEISIERARDKIHDLAGGIGTPEWARPGLRTTAPAKGSTYR